MDKIASGKYFKTFGMILRQRKRKEKNIKKQKIASSDFFIYFSINKMVYTMGILKVYSKNVNIFKNELSQNAKKNFLRCLSKKILFAEEN